MRARRLGRRLVRVLLVVLLLAAAGVVLAFAPPVRRALPVAAPLWRQADRGRDQATLAYRQVWVWLAWPASQAWAGLENLRPARNGAAPKKIAAPSWQAWNAVPATARYRALHGRDLHARQVRTLVKFEVLGPPVLLVLLYLAVGLGGKLGRVRPGISHGSARWAGKRDLRRLRPPAKDRRFILGYGADGDLLAMGKKDIDRHVIIVGPPGSGKSAGLIAPNLLRHVGGESLVIVDPKSELVDLTYAHLSRHYEVRIVNFTNPAVSAGYNPLAFCADPLTTTSFAESWIANTGKSANEPFWENAVRTLLVATVLHLNHELRADGGATLAHLDHFLNAQSSNEVFEALNASKSAEALKTARGFIANVRANDKTESSIFADLGPRFLCLKDQRVKDTTSRHEVDFRAMGRTQGKPIALFVALDRTKAELLRPLTATFFQQLFDELLGVADSRESHRGRLPRRVMFYLDEFGNLGAIPAMPTRVTTVRSAGMPLVMAVQTYDQIEAIYKKEGADIIIPGVGSHIALSSVKGQDARKFSEGAGETTVVSVSASRSRKRGSVIAREGGDSQGELRRSLIMPDEVTRMDEDVMLALVGNMPAVKIRQQRYYAVFGLRRRAALPLLGGGAVPNGGPARADGPLVSPVLDEELAAMQAGHEAGAEAAEADRAAAALGPAEERALLAAQMPEAAGFMDDLAEGFFDFEEADQAWSLAADRGSTEERTGPGAERLFGSEDAWGSPRLAVHDAEGALGARAGRPRRIWEEDVYDSAS